MANHTFITGQFVRIGQRLANASDRVLAWIIDILVMFGLAQLFSSIFMIFHFSSGGGFDWLVYVLSAVLILYPFLSEWLFNGRTVGKMALGIRVVGSDGSMPSVGSLFFRWVFFLIEGFTGFGLVVILLTRNNQRFGDIAGSTYVVKTRKPYYAPSYKLNNFPADYRPYFPQVAQLSQAQVNLIGQVYYLTGSDAEQIRVNLCQKICNYLKLNVSGMTPHQFLSQVNYDFTYLTVREG